MLARHDTDADRFAARTKALPAQDDVNAGKNQLQITLANSTDAFLQQALVDG